MDLGWRIFIHSVRQLLNNLVPALQISALPLIFGNVIITLAGVNAAQQATGAVLAPEQYFSANNFLLILLAVVVYLAVNVWVAVAWHRFVLLEEYPGGMLPAFHKDRFWAYVKASVVVVLLMILIGFLLGLLIGLLGPFFLATGAFGLVVTSLVFWVVMQTFFTRIALVLPAAAVGKEMRIGDSWRDTGDMIAGIAVASALVGLLTLIPSILALTPLSFLVTNVVYQVAASWLLVMLGISILTTVYGHASEGRELI